MASVLNVTERTANYWNSRWSNAWSRVEYSTDAIITYHILLWELSTELHRTVENCTTLECYGRKVWNKEENIIGKGTADVSAVRMLSDDISHQTTSSDKIIFWRTLLCSTKAEASFNARPWLLFTALHCSSLLFPVLHCSSLHFAEEWAPLAFQWDSIAFIEITG